MTSHIHILNFYSEARERKRKSAFSEIPQRSGFFKKRNYTRAKSLRYSAVDSTEKWWLIAATTADDYQGSCNRRRRPRIQSRARPRVEFARPICESERNCCRHNYASDAFSLSFSEMGLPRTGTGVTGRCFINTPIVNCYHLIKSHFPRAFHDSADQGEGLLRRSVIKTAALVPRLVCSFFRPPLSSSLFLSSSHSSSISSRTTIMKSLTSTSIDPLDGNVYPAAKSYEITLRMTCPK